MISVPPIPYKTWFIVTAMVAAITAVLAALGLLRLRGLFGAVTPVAFYFLYLFIAGIWSQYPHEAHFYVVVDSVEIVIFAIFYVLVLNGESAQIFNMMTALPIVSLLYTIFTLRLSIVGGVGMSGTILPFTVPFVISGLSFRRTRRRAALALFCLVAVLLLSQSRAPILAAAVCALMTLAFLRIPLHLKVGIPLLGMVTFFSVIGALWFVPPARQAILGTYSRITYTSAHLTGMEIEEEGSDQVRQLLADDFKRDVQRFQPFGMGYQNFADYYARNHDTAPVSLHSIYYVWALEGGACCVIIVLWIFGAHFTALFRCMKRAAAYPRRELARAVLIATVGVLVMGLFHQMHQVPMTFALLGAGASLGRSRMLPRHVRHSRSKPRFIKPVSTEQAMTSFKRRRPF